MPYLKFSDRLSVKVASIDQQHQQMIEIINDLQMALAAGKGKLVLHDIMARLVDYTRFHFSTEEKWMQQYQYPDRLTHETQHIELNTRLGEFYLKMLEGKTSVTLETLDALEKWLNQHILETDKKMGAYLAEKGVK